VAVLCRVMDVSRSGFYAYMGRYRQPVKADQVRLEATTKEIFKNSGGTYGSRRMARDLQKKDFEIGRYKARTLMNKLDLKVVPAKRFKVTTNSKHNYPVAPNLLNRQFDVKSPDAAWVTDISYIWTREGWLYLAVILDLFSRKVVGWSMSNRMTADLAIEALKMAWWSRKPSEGLIHHSDRGSQYAGHRYQKELKKYKMVCSMSRKGNCWDNAVAERFFRSLKTERTYYRKYNTRDEAKQDIIDYIVMFYNSHRLHSYLDYMSPMEFEKMAIANAA
jgi:putative transposase